MRAREGDFVETSDGLFFDVKGLLHPPGRIVGYIRYYPDNRGTRVLGKRRFSKVYELSQRRRLLKKKWPQYLYYDEVQGRELQGVPIRNVLQLHKPKQRLVALSRSGRRDALERNAVRLIEVLARESKLSPMSFGISGSLLVGLHRQDSDIDVIAYGMATAKRVQKAAFTLLEEDECFHRYIAHDLRRVYTRRTFRDAIGFKDFAMQERRKVFQGRFLEHEYFIRCVKAWREVTEQYGHVQYRPMGQCAISGQVSDDTESLVTPCRYLLSGVRVLRGAQSRRPREIISFRGRFTEQAHTGERVVARGRLEEAQSASAHYYRLVIGEDRTDILRTT